MALDELQARILRTIATNRSPESHVGGGAVIQRQGARLSDDIDVFHHSETNVERYARLDLATLRAAGFNSDLTKQYPGFIEAIVGTEAEGMTRVQWTIDSEYRVLRPVEDEIFGWRLQMPDLAVNKFIAAATRGEARDFVDLAFIDQHYMPLWTLAWAAPAKDDAFAPDAYLNQIERKSLVRVHEIKDLASTEALDGKAIRRRLLKAIETARSIFTALDPKHAGHLYAEDGVPVLRPDRKKAAKGQYQLVGASLGGAWPQIPEIISAEIKSIGDSSGHEL